MKQTFTKSLTILAFAFITTAALAQGSPDFTKSRVMGQFVPSTDTLFVPYRPPYDTTAIMFVHRETYNAFIRMSEAATQDGINLFIVSATRNFQRQAAIWERKWQIFPGEPKEKAINILNYSSMPGTSRHHWGTDIDLCSVEDSDWTKPEMQVTLRWLNENAVKYGFFMPYSDDPERTGYKYEPWHWSYYPLSDYYTELYRILISPEDITGFSGSSLAAELDVIKNYVLGIAKHGKPFSIATVPYDKDAHLVQRIQRQSDQHQRHRIARRRNHRRKNK